MLEEIKRFMQSQDHNGSWMEANESETDYILETIQEWLEDGLESTPRIQSYINYLKGTK